MSLVPLIFIDVGTQRVSKLEKPVPIFSKALSLDITSPYNLLGTSLHTFTF